MADTRLTVEIAVKTTGVEAAKSTAETLAKISRGAAAATAANTNAQVRASERATAAQIRASASVAAAQARASERATAAQIRASASAERVAAAELRSQRQLSAAWHVDQIKRRDAIRAARREALASLGRDTGGFLAGHGFATTGRQMLGVARDISVAGMGAAMAVRGAVSMAGGVFEPLIGLETGMANLRSKGGLSITDAATVQTLVRRVGKSTGFGATATAQAGAELAAAGISSASDLSAAIPTTLRLAKADSSIGGTGNAAAMLVETASQFGMGAKDFESIGDRLAKAANMSTVSVANLGESLTEVGLVARTAGMSLEQTLGTLAMMGEKGGLRGSKAGTGLKAVLSAIAKPSPKSANALRAVGLTDKDVAGAFADLPGFFEKMQSKMDRLHMTTTQRAKLLFTVFQQEGAGAAATLLKNVDALREYNREVKNADGALTTVSDALDQTTEWKLKKFTAAVDEAKITLAEKLAPALHRNLPVAASAAASALDVLGDNLGTISVLGGAWGASLATSAVASIGTSLAAGFTSLGGSATVLAAMTAAGTTIGATFAASLVAAVGGYAGMSAILSMTQDQQRGANVMHDAGASLYDLFSGTSIQRASHRGTIDIGGTPDSGDPMTSGDLPLSSSSAGVAEVGGMITVVVDDQRRPRVITESRGPVGLRVGHNPSGVGKFQ